MSASHTSFCHQCRTNVRTLNQKCCQCAIEILKSCQPGYQPGSGGVNIADNVQPITPIPVEIRHSRNYSSPSSSSSNSAQKKRNKKRKKGFQHYNDRYHRKKRTKKDSHKRRPRIPRIDDSDDSDCVILNVPDFPPPSIASTSSSSIVSTSPSLSVSNLSILERFRQMTLNATKWKDLKLKRNTIRGLEASSLVNVAVPDKDGIELINAIRHNLGHVIGSMLHYEHRVLYLIVGLLEIMKTDPHTLHNNNQPQKPQIMVISSRRHSASICNRFFEEITKFYDNLICRSVIGGTRSGPLIRQLQIGHTVQCGTPGKHCEMIRKKVMTKASMSNLIAFVLDDADELTSSQEMKEQMELIYTVLPQRKFKVLCLLSIANENAMSESKELAHNICDENAQCTALPQQVSSFRECMDDHIVAEVDTDHEKEHLYKEIIQLFNGDKHIVIFFNRKDKLRATFEEYRYRRLSVPWRNIFCLDGDERDNEVRERTLTNFRVDGGILFCSDLLAKGISLPLNVVINFDAAKRLDQYIARLGCAMDKSQPIAVISLVYVTCQDFLTLDQEIIEKVRKKLSVRIRKYGEYSSKRKESLNLN